MYIVNTSFMVDPAIHDRWLESLRKHYLPLLAAQGFDKITFTRVLPATAEEHFTRWTSATCPGTSDWSGNCSRSMPQRPGICSGTN